MVIRIPYENMDMTPQVAEAEATLRETHERRARKRHGLKRKTRLVPQAAEGVLWASGLPR